MKVTIEKKVTETVNVEPGYYRNSLIESSFYYLRESGILVHVNSCAIWFLSPDRSSYKSYINEIIEDYIPCDQSEFEAAKDKVLGQLSHYVKFPETATTVNPLADSPAHYTMQDPNAQQQPANQEVAEQAAGEAAQAEATNEQATVTESAEEGGVEG